MICMSQGGLHFLSACFKTLIAVAGLHFSTGNDPESLVLYGNNDLHGPRASAFSE